MTIDFPATYALRLTETLEPAVAGFGMVATREPTEGAVEYVTVLSDQEPPTASTFPETVDPSLETYNLSIAELIRAPTGIAERLKRSRARRVGVPPRIHAVKPLPKFVLGLPLSTYVSAVTTIVVTVDDAAWAR